MCIGKKTDNQLNLLIGKLKVKQMWSALESDVYDMLELYWSNAVRKKEEEKRLACCVYCSGYLSVLLQCCLAKHCMWLVINTNKKMLGLEEKVVFWKQKQNVIQYNKSGQWYGKQVE